jgi:hypothetical protein
MRGVPDVASLHPGYALTPFRRRHFAAIRQAAVSKPHFPIPKPCRAAAIETARCSMPSRHRDEAEVVLPPFPLRKMCLQRMIEPIRFVAELAVHA